MIRLIACIWVLLAVSAKVPCKATQGQIVNAQSIVLRGKQIDSVTKVLNGTWSANMIPLSSLVDSRMNAQKAALSDSMNKMREWADTMFLQEQVQSDYTQSSTSDPAYIKHKPYIPDTAGQSNRHYVDSAIATRIPYLDTSSAVVTAKRLRDSVVSTIAKIPTNNNQLSNGAGYITGYVETDPIFTASVAHNISTSDTAHYSSGWRERVMSGSYSAGSVTLLKYDGSSVVVTGLPTNNNQLSNGAAYITASSASALTNKTGAISQWTNDAAYLTTVTLAAVTGALGYTPPNPSGTTLQYMRGDGSVATLNTSVVPESGNQYYTDVRARGAIALTTTGSGAATYNSSTGAMNIPANAQLQSNYTASDTSLANFIKNKPNLVKVYNKSGTLRDFNIKILSDTFSVSAGNDYTIDISALGYTQIFSIHAIAIKSTSNGYQSPSVSVDHFTINTVYLDFTQGNNALPVLAVLFAGTVFVTDFTSLKVALTVIGY